MLTAEQNKQFNDILEELGKTLDISKEQHDKAVTSYEFVGEWLSGENSPLAYYNPEILPQGSFMLGTMIKPIHEDDDLDIDLVCRLEGKRYDWTQADLKRIVGSRLKDHGTIKSLLVIPDGRRCWTLQYSEREKFHMDILPAIVSNGYRNILNKAFSETDGTDFKKLEIRITDKKEPNYSSETAPERWLLCNPFGYGIWFDRMARLRLEEKSAFLSAAMQPVPKYQKDKLPLQRVVQILKRHRDIMFNGDEDKPISIIITTLAAKAYQKQTNILEALRSVIKRIPEMIEERYSEKHHAFIKWVENPVNPVENFADKWAENSAKKEKFYSWIRQVGIDIEKALQQRGMALIQESMEKPFGKNIITKAFSSYGDTFLRQRENSAVKMAMGTGMLGTIGRTTVPQHNPFGSHE